jgi:hypothetical protein
MIPDEKKGGAVPGPPSLVVCYTAALDMKVYCYQIRLFVKKKDAS